jgi:hypothetical protein
MCGRCLHGPHWPEQAGMGRAYQPCPFKCDLLHVGSFETSEVLIYYGVGVTSGANCSSH